MSFEMRVALERLLPTALLKPPRPNSLLARTSPSSFRSNTRTDLPFSVGHCRKLSRTTLRGLPLELSKQTSYVYRQNFVHSSLGFENSSAPLKCAQSLVG